jgi:long-subunit fatty acid transport protein
MFANTENYGVILVPILGLYYLSANENFEANLNLPINGDLNYRVCKKAVIGMRFDGLGTTYNLHQSINNTNNAYVAKNSNELFNYLRFELTKSVYLNTKIGYALGRNYEVYDSNDKIDLAVSFFYFGDDRTQLNDNFKNGVIFKIELLYRIHFELKSNLDHNFKINNPRQIIK